MRNALFAGLALIVIATAVVVIRRSLPDSGAERVKAAIAWPAGCADVATHDTTGKGGWPHAVNRSSIVCEHLGPLVLYARFPGADELREDLLRDPPSAPACIAADEVVIDYLDPGQFTRLCRALGGDRVDAVSRLPDFTSDNTIAGMDRAGKAQEIRDTAAQRRALRCYWRIACG